MIKDLAVSGCAAGAGYVAAWFFLEDRKKSALALSTVFIVDWVFGLFLDDYIKTPRHEAFFYCAVLSVSCATATWITRWMSGEGVKVKDIAAAQLWGLAALSAVCVALKNPTKL